MTAGNLLTEGEVAARLGCSKAKVKRLRLSRQLGYLPVRPPLISESDLAAYIETRERKKREAEERRKPREISPREWAIRAVQRAQWFRDRYKKSD